MKRYLAFIGILCLLALHVNGKFLHHQQDDEETITVALIGTNDIHGSAFAREILNTATGEKYKYGGLVYMARLIEIIQDEFGKKVIYLDGGDQIQGGVESGKEVSKGQIMADFYNTLDLKASPLGNHEFDFGPQFLYNYLDKKESTVIGANVESKVLEQKIGDKKKGAEIFDMGEVQVGVIGLSTMQTTKTSSGFTGHKFQEGSYIFHEYEDIVVEKEKELREQGADAVVILSHVGTRCIQNSTYDVRTNETEQQTCIDDEITQLLDALIERGTVINGVIQGHRHQFVHYWYKNIPIMGVINGGYQFNVMYLNFDPESLEVVSSAIEGPIPVCEKVFANTHDCSYKDPQALQSAGELTEWTFHHKEVRAHKELQEIFNEKWVPMMKKYREKFFDTEILMKKVDDKENALGNMVTTFFKEIGIQHGYDVDFSVINPGAFRTQWYPGEVQNQHFYNMFPFQNKIKCFDLSGKDLVEMFKRLQNGKQGFYPADGIFQTVSLQEKVNDAGEKYIQKGFVNATLLNGDQIEPDTDYTGCTLEFLLQGGDDFELVFKQTENIDPETGKPFVPIVARNIRDAGTQRDQTKTKFIEIGTITEQEWGPDPENPRMVVIRK